MGSCCATENETNTKTKDEIDFKRLNTPQEKVLKVLLLGASDSGKTTIIKQLQKLHDGYDSEVSGNIVSDIRESLVFAMKTLCDESMVLSEHYNEETSVHRSIEYLRDEILEMQPPYHLGRDNIYKMTQLWHDEGIQTTLSKRCYFQMIDNLGYFMDKISEIASDEYIPSFEDYVRFARRSTGCTPTRFMSYIDGFGEYTFQIPDIGGTRSERRKWWNQRVISDDVSAIIYCVALSDYDLTLYEDDTTNRLIDAINLFKQIMIKGSFFKKQSVILLFNKYDLFQEKISKVPITAAFPNFPSSMNPNDADDVMRFVAAKFLEVFKAQNIQMDQPLRILRTIAVDTESVDQMFTKIAPEIVKKNLAKFEIDSEANLFV